MLLVLPPISDVTTSYPATSYLTAHLRSRGIGAVQRDWSLEFATRILSRAGMMRLRSWLEALPSGALGEPGHSFLAQAERYIVTIDAVVAFLQGRDPTLDARIAGGRLLPTGPRLREQLAPDALERLRRRFGSGGVADYARYMASVYLLDVESAIREVDQNFRISSYAEQLAQSPASFTPLREAIEDDASFFGCLIDEMVADCIPAEVPKVVALTVPFPGNVFGAFRVARAIRRLAPDARIALGGGWVNTELRHVSDPRVFDYVDYIALDDGERPLECIVEHACGRRAESALLRTFIRRGERVEMRSSEDERDGPFRETVTPVVEGLPLDRYIAWMPGTSPIHRVWAGRWNNLTLAHGCYWRKCTFCDISLDYIHRYETQTAEQIVDHVRKLIQETGTTGFHWVDEAAPPALLRKLSETLIAGDINISWWSMVRFEKAFTPDLAELMAKAGCLMLSGGLEVASDRILRLMRKGVTVEQVARVTRTLADSGIQVHAFLMYGFPTETAQETVDSLEIVRQLFANGCLHSAFWHRFVPTIHSPVGRHPERFGVRITRRPLDDPPPEGIFAVDVLDFEDPTGVDHEVLRDGLAQAVMSYRDQVGMEMEVNHWFGPDAPPTTVAPDRIASALRGWPTASRGLRVAQA